MDSDIRTEANEGARVARLFRNGRSQAVRIPRDMEFSGNEVVIRRDGDRLIIEPARTKPTLQDVLRRLAAEGGVDEPLPDVDDGLLPVETVDL